jgi:hypothetical protein
VDSNFYKQAFSSISFDIPDTLSYAGTFHSELKRNIKEDVSLMASIEKKEDDKLMNKNIYIACRSRLDKILNKLKSMEQ